MSSIDRHERRRDELKGAALAATLPRCARDSSGGGISSIDFEAKSSQRAFREAVRVAQRLSNRSCSRPRCILVP